MTFQAPFYSSSPPETPARKSSYGRNNIFGTSNPSTTPAGPPPSSTGSFTPAGPPPSSFLGSSTMDTQGPLKPLNFSQQSMFNASPGKSNTFNSSTFADSITSSGAPKRSVFEPPKQRGFRAPESDSEEEEYEEGDENTNYVEEEEDSEDLRRSLTNAYGEIEGDRMEDASYDEDEDMIDYESGARSNGFGQRSTSDLFLGAPNAGALVRIQDEDMPDLRASFSAASKPSIFGKIAKDMYSQMGFPAIEESADVVLETEAIITQLYDEGVEMRDDSLEDTLRVISGDLTGLWTEHRTRTARYSSEEYIPSIGPGPSASNFAKANFLGGLALKLHHPKVTSNPTREGIPGALMEWLESNHDHYSSQFEEILVNTPSPANHTLFWGTVFNGILHGKMTLVVDALKNAGWRHARSGMDDMRELASQSGFTGQSLNNVEKVSTAAVQVLSTCPSIAGNWNTRGSDWKLFRIRVSQALEDLKLFAEGRRHNDSVVSDRFGQSSIGKYSTIARKAESQVPWNIYQSFLTLYSLVLGDSVTIIANAQDWCEATFGMMLWWSGEDSSKQSTSMASRARANHGFYLRRLQQALAIVTDKETDFQVNTLNPVEVGLASLLDGDNEAVVGLLRAWSGPISSAVAEVASIGGWLPHAEPQSLINMGSLDDEDMHVLGLTSSPPKVDSVKDQTLIVYSDSLASFEDFEHSKDPQRNREGWELAIAVLGRLDFDDRSKALVADFLANFELDSSETVDKIWNLVTDIGMTSQAEITAEKYAGILANDTHKYGEALWYYALAHNESKVKETLDILISFSLAQSIAYPPEDEMDDYLRRLISSPKAALVELSQMDVPAAELLHKLLSGYATLRKFYNLRDEEVLLPKGARPQKGPVARKAEAVNALLAVISSSDDNIRGGLYDEQRGAVVCVDFLLALLGEGMVFVNQPNPTLSASQIDILLKAIEDLQAVGPRIYGGCTDFLQTVLASAPGLKGSTPSDMLRKSTSNVSGTSSFSLVGSSMLASQLKQSIGGSGVMVKGNTKRGWDWRRGVSAGTSGDDVLRILRLGLAKDLARAWLLEADSGL
ncbi:Nucleoporin [Lachnellula suecica]|uniref:Nuclear pore complex protein Nup85 n=1 Tax=Lachnellula suecica TaxID=602035 RepID=A0A8T9C9E0_9HELO|nr:Nucleoporin [Lachnellula suecica]